MAKSKNPQQDEPITDNHQEQEKGSIKAVFKAVQLFLKDRLSILDNANPEKTIEGIERDIEFKGFNLWILIPAILIASIGLNANSTAVIVGAMLISPLMGPIMGIGLSVGINDFTMLKRGLRNLGVAVGVSIITSTLFFLIIPIDDASSELLARVRPDIRDVLIGFFGGFAGILAGSRREKNNVIPGVAIATALMPPLCTAGFGLATFQFNYFFGAAYLFLINAFFIALATVLVVRYLRFPVKTFIDSSTERRAKNLLAVTVLIMIIPASIIFYQVVVETITRRNIELFITENVNNYEGSEVVKKDVILTDTVAYVNLVMFGDPIPAKTIQSWQNELSGKVENCRLRIFQGTDKEALPEVSKLVDMYTRTQEEIATKEDLIIALQSTIRAYEETVLPSSILKEIKINYPEVLAIKMGRMTFTDFNGHETESEPNFFVSWRPEVPDSVVANRSVQLEKWLSARFISDSVRVERFSLDWIKMNPDTTKKELNEKAAN